MTTFKQFIQRKTKRTTQRSEQPLRDDSITRKGSEKLWETEALGHHSSSSKRFSVHSILNSEHQVKNVRRRSCDPTLGRVTCESTLKRNQSIDSTNLNRTKGKVSTLKKVFTLRERYGDSLFKTFKSSTGKISKNYCVNNGMRLNESTPCLPTESSIRLCNNNNNTMDLIGHDCDDCYVDPEQKRKKEFTSVPNTTFINIDSDSSSSSSSSDEVCLYEPNEVATVVKKHSFSYHTKSHFYPKDCVSNELYDHHLLIIKKRIDNTQQTKTVNEQFAYILKIVLENMLNLIDYNNIELGRWMGEGQYGRVYEAVYKKQNLVVKVPKTFHSTHASLNEAKAMNGLRHKNIVEYIGVTVINDNLCVILEKIPKGNLRDFIRRFKPSVSIKEFFYYACDVCSALVYLNEVNIVHRDVAARNVFVVDRQYVKLGDFGLALVGGDKEILHPLPVRWTSPESLSSKKFSHKSDVWSFGVFMWELFTYGSLPFSEYSTQHVIKLIKSGVTLPCPSICPNDIFKLLQWAWKQNPNERPNASVLLERLKKQKELFLTVSNLYASAPIRLRYKKYSDINRLQQQKEKFRLHIPDNKPFKGRSGLFHKVFMRQASIDKEYLY